MVRKNFYMQIYWVGVGVGLGEGMLPIFRKKIFKEFLPCRIKFFVSRSIFHKIEVKPMINKEEKIQEDDIN